LEAVDVHFDLLFSSIKQNLVEGSAYLMAVSPAIARVLRSLLENQESIEEGECEWRRLSAEDQCALVGKFF
jgi:hypothetical protein